MTIHIAAAPTTTVAGPAHHARLTLRRAVVEDIKRNTREGLQHLASSATRVCTDAVGLGLFFLGGEDQRRMVEWTRRHSCETRATRR